MPAATGLTLPMLPLDWGLFDLVTVLHEFGHGLGFQTFTSGSSGVQFDGRPTWAGATVTNSLPSVLSLAINGELLHTVLPPDDLTFRLLQDIGW